MSISNISGVGEMSSNRNKLYHVSIPVSFGLISGRINFYSTVEISSYSDTVDYIVNHGITGAGGSKLIYVYGTVNSEGVAVTGFSLSVPQNQTKITVLAITSEGQQITADITSQYPDAYFVSYEV